MRSAYKPIWTDTCRGRTLCQLSFAGHGKQPGYAQVPIGGISESAPLVAGIVMAGERGQPGSLGFIIPAIYQVTGTAAFFPTRLPTSRSPALDRGVVCDLAEFANICGKPALTLTTFNDQSPALAEYTGQVTLPGSDIMIGLGIPDSPPVHRRPLAFGRLNGRGAARQTCPGRRCITRRVPQWSNRCTRSC